MRLSEMPATGRNSIFLTCALWLLSSRAEVEETRETGPCSFSLNRTTLLSAFEVNGKKRDDAALTFNLRIFLSALPVCRLKSCQASLRGYVDAHSDTENTSVKGDVLPLQITNSSCSWSDQCIYGDTYARTCCLLQVKFVLGWPTALKSGYAPYSSPQRTCLTKSRLSQRLLCFWAQLSWRSY